MKTIISSLLALIIINTSIYSQITFPSYYTQNEFGMTSPGAMKYGLYGYNNPAILATLNQTDILFSWTDETGNWNDLNHWGLFTAIPNLSFAVINQKDFGTSVTDYKLSAAAGNNSLSFGLGYGWSGGDVSLFHHSTLLTLGTLYRPNRYLSMGLIGNFPDLRKNEGIIDLALRPFGDEKISFFGDYEFKENRDPLEIKWSAGAAIEAYPGFRLTARYFNTKMFNMGVELSFGNISFSSHANYDKNGNHEYNVYGIRFGGYDRNPFMNLFPKHKYVEMNLLGPVKYQRFKFFDNSNTLKSIITEIDAAKNDKSVAGIAINTSGMTANKEIVWELREKLKQFRASGKHIVIFIDNTGIVKYDLASVADKIIMDPEGLLTLEGFIYGKNYYKGILEKLGIGYHEWRYFKYKSAMEVFSRYRMSKPDSAQLQRLVDVDYKVAEQDICSGRNIIPKKFNDLVNNQTAFLAGDAVKAGLVDAIGRWDKVKEIVKELERKHESFVSPNSLAKFNLPNDNYWGEKPKIAVIYAIGVCAMDEGINARSLVKDVQAVTNDDNVKALVLRVDSPGGDGMASDIIAEAIKKCTKKKPVIVSQGYVAASGGYWLSMYGNKIVAAPNTITGSIGVIGGWFYNKGLDSKLGVTTDYVKKGEHADLGFGFRLPFVGISLPDRDLSPEEQGKVESLLKTMYKGFVSKVAHGRNQTISYIDSIGQGRVWSGEDGLKVGLVDTLGGLSTAIRLAAGKAGLNGKEYRVVEYPKPGWFNFNIFIPKLFGLNLNIEDSYIKNIKYRFQNNGRPIPMLPLENMGLLQKAY